MININSKNLLQYIISYFIYIGCNEKEVRTFFSARNFIDAVAFKLPAVCLLGSNKPAESHSKQSHIHVTSMSRFFFYPNIEHNSATTDWKDQPLIVSLSNINSLLKNNISQDLNLVETKMMTKIEGRQSGESQVQLSKLKEDGEDFINLRRGLYLDDMLIFLKYRDSNKMFALGIPAKYVQENSYEFINESSPNKPFKNTFYASIESKNAISVKSALNNILDDNDGIASEVVESEDSITDAIYQSMVDSADASKTDDTPEEYVGNSAEKNTKSNRPKTNPSIGKEAIKDNGFRCALDPSHTTFIKPDGTIYMEAHHLIPLGEQKNYKNKLDKKANIIPLCPLCHRKIHYGKMEDIEPLIKKLYDDRKSRLKSIGLEISYNDLIEQYK